MNKKIVIATGASAGGLESLQSFLSHLPLLPNCSVIVAQHLSPTHKSMLVQLLSEQTPWQIIEAKSGLELEEYVVYITPPGTNITVLNGTINLMETETEIGSKPSVDLLFESLAEQNTVFAVGVILSGTGTDGALGVKKLHLHGFPTFVQTPESSRYSGMPLSALSTEKTEGAFPAEQLGAAIATYLREHIDVLISEATLEKKVNELPEIIQLLAQKTGADFKNYKSSSIERRIEKRVSELGLSDVTEYVHYLYEHPEEPQLLYEQVLIGVTSFFRDKKAFVLLTEQLELLLKQKKQEDTLRIWIPACSSGEEAYSIAILVHQLIVKKFPSIFAQIFATDIDEKSIDKARKGLYTSESLSEIPQELVNEYFTPKQSGFELIKPIRSMVLFSKHDVIKNAPFLKVDLISCRNLLIYFNTTLQQKILSVFYYALVQNGLLFLGNSETVGYFTDYFEPLDNHVRLFIKKESANKIPVDTVQKKGSNEKKAHLTKPNIPKNLSEQIKETLYSTFEHPFVVINQSQQILEVRGDVRLYLSLPTGKLQLNLFKMLNNDFESDVRAVVLTSQKDQTIQQTPVKRFSLFGKLFYVRITCKPIQSVTTSETLSMVIFEDLNLNAFIPDSVPIDSVELETARIKEIEQELKTTKQHLQTYIEEIETANEELQSVNEELNTTNEELQASNEELETTNEELQSSNEEIQIAYSQLKAALAELDMKEKALQFTQEKTQALLNNDLQSFILIDKSYKILQFNKKAREFFGSMRAKEFKEGEVILDFLPPGHIENFISDFEYTMRNEYYTGEKTITDYYGEQHWLSVHFQKISETTTGLVGASIAFFDITALKNALSQLSESEKLVQTVFNKVPSGLALVDETGFFVDVNDNFCFIYDYNRNELLNQHCSIVASPEKREKIKLQHIEFIKTGKEITHEYIVFRKDGVKRIVNVTFELIVNTDGKRFKLVIVNDVTQQREAQEQLQESEKKYRDLFNLGPTPSYIYDNVTFEILDVNQLAVKFYGYSYDEFLNMTIKDLRPPEHIPLMVQSHQANLHESGIIHFGTFVHQLKNGTQIFAEITGQHVVYKNRSCTIINSKDMTDKLIEQRQKNLQISLSALFQKEDSFVAILEQAAELFSDNKGVLLCEIWLKSNDLQQLERKAWYVKPELTHGADLLPTFEIWQNQAFQEKLITNKPIICPVGLTHSNPFIRFLSSENLAYSDLIIFPLVIGEKVIGCVFLGVNDYTDVLASYNHHYDEIKDTFAKEIQRKQLQDELQKHFETSPDLLVIAGLDGYFKKVNDAGVKLLGYSKEELLSKPFSAFIHPADLQKTGIEFDINKTGKFTTSFENRYITKSGEIIWLSWSSSTDMELGITYSIARNITQQKKLQILADSAADLAKIGAWELDRQESDTWKIWVSSMGERILGTSLSGKIEIDHLLSFFPEHEQLHLHELISTFSSNNDKFDCETQIQLPDGTQKWIRLIGKGEFSSGKLQHVTGSIQDISQRKSNDIELSKRTRYVEVIAQITEKFLKQDNWYLSLQTIFELAGKTTAIDRVYYFERHQHPENTQQWVFSQRFEWNSGTAEPQFENETLQLIPEDQFEVFFEPMQHGQVFKSLVAQIEDHSLREALASQDIKSILALPIYVQNTIFGFIGFDDCKHERIWSDLDVFFLDSLASNLSAAIERRNSELQLEQAFLEKKDILESMDDGFFTMNKQWEITYWNTAAEQMSGISRRNILNRFIWDVLEKPKLLQDEHIKKVLESEKPISFEVYLDKNHTWLEVNAYPVKTGISIFFRDITKLKEFNDTLTNKNRELERKAKELAASNAELEQFAYVASHDLQEPLRMVSGFLTQLEKKYAPQLDDKALQYIQFAVDGAKRMQQIILDLLEYSRVGVVKSELKKVNLNQVVKEVLEMHQTTSSLLDADIRCENLPIVKTQRTYMVQLFQNLIGNALKYHHKNTKPLVHIYMDDLGSAWKISVKDNGIGIEKEYFGKIFELFQRLHGKEVYTGSGLGLAISKKIVENLGGKIYVESEPGVGSIFSFTLPKEPNET